MTGVNDKQLLPVGPFYAGVDNLDAETALTRSDDGKRIVALREAVNVDIPRDGWPQRRKGFTLECAGARVHSLWHGGRFPFMLFANGPDLYARRAGGDPFLVRSGLSPREVSYAIPNDRVYASNGVEAWCVLPDGTSAAWGVETPAHQPQAIASANGGLDAGRYQFATTFIDARGEESGTARAEEIDVAQAGGVQLTNIAQPASADVARVRVYVSHANGDMLYQARDLAVGQTAALIGAGQRGKPLDTQFLSPMPPGQIVRYLAGRMYVARGREMRWSEALRYGLTHREKNVRRVGETIAMMEPVGEGGDAPGLFVSDHKRTYWLGGADPATQSNRIAYPYPAIPGTGRIVPGSMFGFDTAVPVAYWIARNGVAIVGLPGGQVVPLREKQVVAPNAERGSSLFLERDGIRTIITSLQGSTAQGLAVTDRASSRVYRNGVEI